MKKALLILLISLTTKLLHAQNVGIGTNIPNNSAILELSSTNKGLLLPRVADTSSVTAPVKGLQVYSLASNKLWYHDGTRWQGGGNGNNSDTIWTMQQDSIAYTNKKYVAVNTDLSISTIQEGIQANGNLLVQGKLSHSNSSPTAAQIYTMTNLSAMQDIPGSDSVFRIYDPGGTGNYNNNTQGNIHFNFPNTEVGYRVNSAAADYGFGTGDTLWLSQFSFPACRTTYIYRFTAANPIPANFTVTGTYYVLFRSNADGSNGKGFNLTFTRFYIKTPVQKIETAGNTMLFNSTDGSFSSGFTARARGDYSTAFGQLATANGNSSFAAGFQAYAGGSVSFAGGSSRAYGDYSTAMGAGNDATGDQSVALGSGNTSSGSSSFATGISTEASGSGAASFGSFSTALGDYSFTTGANNLSGGSYSNTFGRGLISRGYSSTVIGLYNDPIAASNQTSVSGFTPLFIIGDGDDASNRANAMVVMRGGNVGFGINNPAYKLEVNGSQMIRNDNRPSLQVRKTNNVGGYMVVTEDDDMEIGTNIWNTTGKLMFSLNSEVKLTIDVDGDTKLDGNMTFNKSSNTTLNLQANAVDKGFVQLSGNDLRMGTFSSNSTGRIILRSSGSDQLVIDPTGDATLAGDLTVRGNRGILINGSSGSTLKYYTRTVGIATALSAFGSLDNIDIPFAAGMFTVAPEVMVGDVVSTGGASGELLRTQLIIYNVTATGCKGKVINTSNAAINYSTTWNISCIGR